MVSLYGLDSAELMGCFEHGNEPSGSLKGWLFRDKVSEYWFLKDSAP
jgi:hypothetical protein